MLCRELRLHSWYELEPRYMMWVLVFGGDAVKRRFTEDFVCGQATYDTATQEFVIDTPNNLASKYWIGGAAQHGKVPEPACLSCIVTGDLHTLSFSWPMGE
jgi:hypothetical protein